MCVYNIIQSFFIFYVCSIYVGVCEPAGKLRNVGGDDAKTNELGYVLKLALKINDEKGEKVIPICTASSLKPTWSLTAAHCIRGMEEVLCPQHVTGVLLEDQFRNVTNRHGEEKNKTVAIIIQCVHPSYYNTDFGTHNDIGLIQHEAIILEFYAHINPVDFRTLTGLEVISAGYGITRKEIDGKIVFNSTNELQIPLQVIRLVVTKCNVDFNPIYVPKFCLVPKCYQQKTVSMCKGDSGGPLISNNGIIGVNTGAFHDLCTYKKNYYNRKLSGLGTPVSPYLSWINHQINKI